MEVHLKEVYYHEYCPRCIYLEKEENEPPCDECLSRSTEWGSHKPIKFKERGNENGGKEKQKAEKCKNGVHRKKHGFRRLRRGSKEERNKENGGV